MPDFDLYVQNLYEDVENPGHFVPARGEFLPGQHAPPEAKVVNQKGEVGTSVLSNWFTLTCMLYDTNRMFEQEPFFKTFGPL